MVREHMTAFCEANQLHLARIFHDLDVEPTQLDYPGLRGVVSCVSQPYTHALLVADLEFVREPSAALTTIVRTMSDTFPDLRIHCFVDEHAVAVLSEQDGGADLHSAG